MKQFSALAFLCLTAPFLCTPVLAAQWVKFAKEGQTSFYYEEGSRQCFKNFDRQSGITTGYEATAWITTSDENKPSKDNMVMWSLSCTSRKLDKEGRDNPDIFGERIRPDSVEEKLYKRICPICESAWYK